MVWTAMLYADALPRPVVMLSCRDQYSSACADTLATTTDNARIPMTTLFDPDICALLRHFAANPERAHLEDMAERARCTLLNLRLTPQEIVAVVSGIARVKRGRELQTSYRRLHKVR